MEPEARYTFVGAVVLALLVAAIAGYTWLAGGANDDDRKYAIHFEKQSLEGLQVGSPVNIRGVKVGQVEAYSISQDNINRVDVVVRVDRQTPVSRNTTAVVGRNLVTGVGRIDLVTPGVPGPELVQVPDGERFPVIPEGTSDIEQIADAMSRLAVNGQAALSHIEQLLNAENRQTLIDTVASVRDLARGLDQRLDRIDVLADSVRETALGMQESSRDIARSIEQLAREGSLAAKQVTPLVQEARVALQTLSAAARSLERQSTAVADRVATAADTGTLELQATARELRRGAEQLSRAVAGLRDPRSALLGPSENQLGPGERMP